ncbi:hypothetical protein KKB18_10725 [bacterium]|nr:hypothetical protein [bacterium]
MDRTHSNVYIANILKVADIVYKYIAETTCLDYLTTRYPDVNSGVTFEEYNDEIAIIG